MMNDFVALIISHGRPDNVMTYHTLRRLGYTGEIRIVIDNLDKKSDEYYKKYGREVVMFDKEEISKTTDQGDNFNNLRTTTHARNACFEIAKEQGFKYFVVLDDDYNNFSWRFNYNFDFVHTRLTKLDKIFKVMTEFLKSTPILSIAFAQGGDYIGGVNGAFGKKVCLKRKCMNSFFCSIDKPFKFFSRLNEDVNTYITLGNRGDIFFTTNMIMLNQMATQANSGGMTEAYLDFGTYVKSFYSVMYMPSSVKVRMMGTSHRRLHHWINWQRTVPKILSADLKKI